MFFYALKPVHTVLDAIVIFSIFPISIAMVAILENLAGLD